MTTDTMAVPGLYALLTTLAKPDREAVVPEPEFKPFKLPSRDGEAVRLAELAPANTPALPAGAGDLAA
jgi:hypothetical protein